MVRFSFARDPCVSFGVIGITVRSRRHWRSRCLLEAGLSVPRDAAPSNSVAGRPREKRWPPFHSAIWPKALAGRAGNDRNPMRSRAAIAWASRTESNSGIELINRRMATLIPFRLSPFAYPPFELQRRLTSPRGQRARLCRHGLHDEERTGCARTARTRDAARGRPRSRCARKTTVWVEPKLSRRVRWRSWLSHSKAERRLN